MHVMLFVMCHACNVLDLFAMFCNDGMFISHRKLAIMAWRQLIRMSWIITESRAYKITLVVTV